MTEQQFIKITREKEVMAEQTTNHSSSSYGQPVWVILDDDPAPGPCELTHNGETFPLEIIGVKSGWLIARDERGYLIGVIWTNGSFYADNIVGKNGIPVTVLTDGCHVNGTLPVGNLGSVLF